jgi:hypothetical protein
MGQTRKLSYAIHKKKYRFTRTGPSRSGVKKKTPPSLTNSARVWYEALDE